MNLNSRVPQRDTLTHQHPYLSGIYAPTLENVSEIELEVFGNIPPEFEGSYYRNGPNPLCDGFSQHHWFDGDGMIHKLNFSEGRVTYRNRYVRTAGYELELKRGQKSFSGLEEIGNCSSLMQTASSAVKNMLGQCEAFPPKVGRIFKDTANTDLVMYRGKLIPLWWLSGTPYQLDPDTLKTVGRETFNSTYHGDVAAHARIDAGTGELFFLDFGQLQSFVAVNCVGRNGQFSWRKQIRLPYPKMFHDLLFTKNYVVLLDFPFGFRPEPETGSMRLSLDRSDDTGFSRVVLLNRLDGSIAKEFKFPSTYVLHGLNAYENNDKVFIQVIKYPDPVGERGLTNGASSVGALKVNTVTAEWMLDLTTNQFYEKIIDDRNTEFGRVNDDYLGKESRFSYQPKLKTGSEVKFDSILKVDFKTHRVLGLNLPQGLVAEEPFFLPRLHSSGEDDGWLAFICNDESSTGTQFRIYDAQSLDPDPVAIVKFPSTFRIPAGFHGKWHSSVSTVKCAERLSISEQVKGHRSSER